MSRAVLLLLAFSVKEVGAQTQFVASGSMVVDRHNAESSVQLTNGNILIVGGASAADGTGSPLSSAEVFDSNTMQFSVVPSQMAAGRKRPLIAALNDGRALIVGGYTIDGSSLVLTAEIYDPVSNSFTLVAAPPDARYAGGAVTLLDGRVLFAANWGPNWTPRNWALIYDPSTNAWTSVSMNTSRCTTGIVRLLDGRVLVAGGYLNAVSNPLPVTAATEIFDPSTNTFTLAGNLSESRGSPYCTVLPTGKILICGGSASGGGYLTSCDIVDPANLSVIGITRLAASHSFLRLATTDDGRVLITAPESPMAELFDPTTNTFTPPPAMPSVARTAGASYSLPNRQILIVGGRQLSSSASATQAERYVRANSLPVANAGEDRVIYCGTASQAIVTLDGSASFDADGDPLTYTWAGPFETVTGIAPNVTLSQGIHPVVLTVRDSANQSATATILVAVVPGVDSATYANIQAQVQSLTNEVNSLNVLVQQLTTRNAALQAALQSVSGGVDQIKILANSIIGVCDQNKTTITNTAGN